MTRLLAALLATSAVLAAIPAGAAPAGAAPLPEHLFKKPPVYFPTEVGAEWVYDDENDRLSRHESPVGIRIVNTEPSPSLE